MHPLEQRPRQDDVEPILDEVVHGTEAQRAKVDPPYTLLREPPLELDRRPLGTVEPQGKEHAYGLVAQPPNRELEREEGRSVEPLKIVNRDNQAAIASRVPQCTENREGDRRLIGRAPLRVGSEQRRLERLTLRRRKLGEAVIEHRVEEIGESRVRQLRFCLGGPRGKHGIATRLQLFHDCAPDGRLPNPGIALECNDRRKRRERCARRVEFLFSPYQLASHTCSIPPSRTPRYVRQRRGCTRTLFLLRLRNAFPRVKDEKTGGEEQ